MLLSFYFIKLTEELINAGLFEESVRRGYDKQKQGWLNRDGDYYAYIGAVIKVFEENIKGIPFTDFQEAGGEWWSARMLYIAYNDVGAETARSRRPS